MAGNSKVGSIKLLFMKALCLILFIIFCDALKSQSQSTGYVLLMEDSTLKIPDNSISISKVSSLQAFLDAKLAITGNGSQLTGLTKAQVGLSNVDNTSDANKPVSSATTTALNLKANLASPTFTGTVSGITASMVGLGNVNNTSDLAKPISIATQAALDGKQATLVSATNIKTVNGNTLLGSGDIVVGGGATSSTAGVAASATASGTQTITHNLGRTPTIIRIYSISNFTSSTSATPVPFSNGIWNSSGNRCVYMVINGTTSQVSQTSTVFSVIMVTSAGNQITGVIGNVTNTGFDIVWSETGTHTAGNFLWECQ